MLTSTFFRSEPPSARAGSRSPNAPGERERSTAEFSVAALQSQLGQGPRVVCVSQDVTARKKADLERLRSDRRKDEFFAMLAHELRNPLEPIRSAAALLAQLHVDGPASAQKAASVIERQVSHLTRLVDDLLDVARINHGKMRLDSEAIRLQQVIDAAVDANRALAEKSRLQLRVKRPQNDVWVLGDSVRLAQVFGNLLHNATKFSVAAGTIEISVRPRESDRQVAVSVRDEGIGIAVDPVDSIFDLFTQDEQLLARDRRGLGIGLAVVRSLVELHGGTVSVHSGGIGKGSEFVVMLPTTDAPPARANVPFEVHNRTGRRVLLVDDDRDAAESMQALLELQGHTVALAFSGQAALDQVARLKPEVVILDIGLPDISGHDVARRLRADASLAAPLLVALTGYGRDQDRNEARAAGFDHHLVKPADPATLMEVLAG